MLKKPLFVGLMCFSFPAWADEALAPGADDVQIFVEQYFQLYNPQTARDMVDRLPGFTIDLGEDLRGYGSTAGNILIDGARPLSKSGGIEAALERISADSVDSIELRRGTSGNNETGDQSITANIILKPDPSSGFWRAALERNANGQISSSANISYATDLGKWKLSGRFLGSLNRYPFSAGGNRISRDAEGRLTDFQTEEIPLNSESFTFYGGADRTLWGGRFKLSGWFRTRPLTLDIGRQGFGEGGPEGALLDSTSIEIKRSVKDGELGAEWANSPDEGWGLKVLSLLSYEDFSRGQDVRTDRPAGEFASSSLFTRDQEALEAILRAAAQQTVGKKTYDLGGEFAYNRLESALALTRTTSTEVRSINLPAANVTIEEYRGEAFAKLIWPLSDRLTAEGRLTAEHSAIQVTGDAESSQSFTFLKPSVALSYDLRSDVQLRVRARRDVGQLDFSDFAASASASDDRLIAGNPELGPDQTTSLSFAVDYRSKGKLAVNLEAFHEWRDDILEELILPSGGSGIANAGSGRFWGLRATGSFPLDFVLSGGLLQIRSEFVDSRFADPITGTVRQISGTDTPMVSADFRQDFPAANWSWGMSYTAPFDGTVFFTGEESFNRDSASYGAFVETTRFLDAKIRLEWAAIGGQDFRRERRFFAPDRSSSFNGSQVINSRINSSLTLTLSKQF